MRWGRVNLELIVYSEKNTLTRCHVCSNRLTRWIFAFYLVANASCSVRIISVYSANEWDTWIKIKIKPSFTQRVRAMLGLYYGYVSLSVNALWQCCPTFAELGQLWKNGPIDGTTYEPWLGEVSCCMYYNKIIIYNIIIIHEVLECLRAHTAWPNQ